MVKGREWFSVVKKALTPQWKKAQETSKSKQKRQSKTKDSGSEEPETEVPNPLPAEDAKVAEAENEHKRHAYSVALATSMAATAAVAAARAAMEAVRVASMQWISSEKTAATKIQTAFRGYLVRRELRALRRSTRLKSLIQGQSIKRQAAATLRCMQTLAHVQAQVRARRLRMSEENRILQHQLQQKQEKEVEKFNDSVGGEWNDSRKSKEQSEALKQNKQEAAMRRERALVYAFSHQRSWKVSSKGENQTLMDPNNPHWGWSWLERWMAARPWEIPNSTPNNASLNTATASSIVKNNNKPSATPSISSRRIPAPRSLSTPPSQGSVSSKIRMPSPRVPRREGNENSKLDRRHSSIERLSSTRNNEGFGSSPPMPSFKEVMAPTRMSKSRSTRLSTSPLKKYGMPEKELEPVSSKIRMPSPRVPRHGGDKNSKLDRRHSSIERLSSARNDEGFGSLSPMPSFKEVVAPTLPSKARSSRLSTSPLKKNAMPEKGLGRVSSKIRMPSPRVPRREGDENSKLSSHQRRHSSIESVSSTRNDEGFGSLPPMPSFKEVMAPTQPSKSRSSRLLTSPLKQNGMPEKGLEPVSSKIRMTSPSVPQRRSDENSKLNHHRRRHSSIESLPSTRNYEGFGSSPPMRSFNEEVMALTKPSKARSSRLSTSPLKQNGMLASAAKKQLSFPVSTGKSMKQSGLRMANTKAVVKDVKVKISKN